MALTGDLRNIGLADLFQTLHQNHATGILEIANDSARKKLLFSDAGVTLASRRTMGGFRIGKRLVGLGILTSDDIQSALQQQQEKGGLIGEILVGRALCTESDILSVVRYHVEEELYELFTWTEGTFSFHEGGAPSEEELAGPYQAISLDPERAILDAARRIDECRMAWEALPGRGEILTQTISSDEELDESDWEHAALALYPLIDGTRTVDEILDDLFISEFEAVPILLELQERGLIRKLTVTELRSSASVLSVRGDHKRAVQCLNAALVQRPDDSDLLMSLCSIYEQQGDKRHAAQLLQHVAQLRYGTKDFIASSELLSKAARYDPGSAEIQEQLALLLQQADDQAGAIEAYLKAGALLNERGDFEAAVDLCALALELDPDSIKLRHMLANAYVGAGDTAEAVEQLVQLAPLLESQGTRAQIEGIYRQILLLDSSRREYLARLERITLEGLRRRKRIKISALCGAVVLIVACLAVVAASGGPSADELLGEARALLSADNLAGAARLADQIIEADSDSDTAREARGILLTVARRRHETDGPQMAARNTIDSALKEKLEKANELFLMGNFEQGIISLVLMVDYLADEDTQKLLKDIGKRDEKAILSEYRVLTVDLLKRYVEELAHTVRTSKTQLSGLSDERLTTWEIGQVKDALKKAEKLRKSTDPKVHERNAGNTEAVETALCNGARDQTQALLKTIDDLGSVHDEVTGLYHTLHAAVLRNDLRKAFTEVSQVANSLKDQGELRKAREACARYLARCSELRRERPAGYYALVVEELLGDDALDLDGKMELEMEVIDRVLGEIELAERSIQEGRHEQANALLRSLIRDNFRIDFRNLIKMALWVRTSPLGAEVMTSWNGRPEVSLGTTTEEGILVRYPPQRKTVISVRKETFEPIVIEIRNITEEHPAAHVYRLKKQVAWQADGVGPQESRPTLWGGFLLLAGRDGYVRTMDLETGKPGMDHDHDLLSGFTGHPLLVGDIAWLTSLDQRLIAFDLTARKVLADIRCGARLRTSPLKLEETIVVANEQGLVLAFKNGEDLWRRELTGRVRADPVATSSTIYVATSRGTVNALDPDTGRIRWTVEIHEPVHAPLAVDPAGRVIVATDAGTVRMFDESDGRELWVARLDNAARGRPTVADGQVWACTLSGGIYVISLEDGSIHRRLSSLHSVPIQQGPVLDGDRFYIVDDNGKLGCIDYDGNNLWRVDLQTTAATAPVLANGRVYVATSTGSVYCFMR